jgi:hypothetical protein
MKKEILFFTDNSEIGTPNVPVKNKQFKDGGVENGDYQKVELELSNNSKSNYVPAVKIKALFDYDNEKIKFVGLDTFDNFRMRWIKVQENKSGYFITAKYFGGVVYIDNYLKILSDYKKQTNPKMAEGGLIAPNGERSYLTPEQYKLVRTPAFKKWFGDWENDPENASKVVDENGEPLVVYREIQPNDTKYFNTELQNALQSIKWETNLTEILTTKSAAQAKIGDKVENGKKRGVITDITDGIFKIKYEDDTVSSSTAFGITFYGEATAKNILTAFLNIRILGGFSNALSHSFANLRDSGILMKSFNNKTYFTFRSYQAKLADGTNTTFDGNNPDIRFKDGGSIDNERIDCHRCDWSWKVVDGGDDLYVCHKCGYDNAPYYATKFAGGGGIDINEPFNVNGKTLAERVRILVKQLYPDYKWSITSTYSKLDVYLLEADFDPFTDKWKEEHPDRELYYNVDDRDFESYNRQYNAKITDRAVEVFKPIRDYINKFIVNYNANDPYADYSNYNVYEYTYIGKWDKPYKQVEPKAGKKVKAKATVTNTPSPTTLTPRADYPFEMGDILAPSKEKLDGLSLGLAAELSQYYYEVAEMITPTQQYFIEYNDRNESQTVTVESIDILKGYVKATVPLFKMGDTVVKDGFPNNPLKIVHRSYYQQTGVKYSTLEKRFLLSGMYWNYALEDATYANEDELELYNATPITATQEKGLPSTDPQTWNAQFKVGDNVKIRWDFSNDLGLPDTKGNAKVDYFSNDNNFTIVRIDKRFQEPEATGGIQRTENPTGLLYVLSNKQSWEGKDLELIDGASNSTSATPTTQPQYNFLDYLIANSEKANKFGKDLEISSSFAMFVNAANQIENMPKQEYAELMSELLDKFPKTTN